MRKIFLLTLSVMFAFFAIAQTPISISTQPNFTYTENINIEYINQIDEKILIIWHDHLTNKGDLTQKSIRRKLNSLSSLLEFCKKRKLITINPMIFIQKPKYKEESKTNSFTHFYNMLIFDSR